MSRFKSSPKEEILKSSPQYQKKSPKYADHPPSPMLDTDLQPCKGGVYTSRKVFSKHYRYGSAGIKKSTQIMFERVIQVCVYLYRSYF